MSATYFAVDGSYGSGEGIVIVDTSKWTEDDWEAIEAEDEYFRPRLAQQICQEREAN